ncbi:hypothetical protein ACIHDR_49480 [Nocardia sp. NPDC052278]|uniref:hypothetical protein n=1 Tax=unclassified Nocardia TaxID=2637762 RepID=UPI0036C2E7D5
MSSKMMCRQLPARLPQIAPCGAAATGTTSEASEQQAQAEHPDRPDRDPVEEKFPRGDAEVIVEYTEITWCRTNFARIGRHSGNADNYRADENDEPDNNDHDNPVALVDITFAADRAWFTGSPVSQSSVS